MLLFSTQDKIKYSLLNPDGQKNKIKVMAMLTHSFSTVGFCMCLIYSLGFNWCLFSYLHLNMSSTSPTQCVMWLWASSLLRHHHSSTLVPSNVLCLTLKGSNFTHLGHSLFLNPHTSGRWDTFKFSKLHVLNTVNGFIYFRMKNTVIYAAVTITCLAALFMSVNRKKLNDILFHLPFIQFR